jgi:hypothetical protein
MKGLTFKWHEKDAYLASMILSRERRVETIEIVPESLPHKRKFVRVSENVVMVPRTGFVVA